MTLQEAEEEAQRINSKFDELLKKHRNIDKSVNLKTRHLEAESVNFHASYLKNESSVNPSFVSTQRTDCPGSKGNNSSQGRERRDDKKYNFKNLTTSQKELMKIVSSITSKKIQGQPLEKKKMSMTLSMNI